MKFVAPLIFFIMWQISAGVMAQHFFPTPLMILSSIDAQVLSQVTRDIFFSMNRLFIGSSLGIGLGIGFGSLIGLNNWLYRALMPMINAFRSIPVASLFPVIMLFFGLTESAAIFILAWVALVPVIIATIDSVQLSKKEYSDFCHTFKLNWYDTYFKVYLPSSAPAVLSGVDISLNLAFKFLIIAELFGIQNGLGMRLSESADFMNYNKMYFLVIVIAIIGMLIASAFSMFKNYILLRKLRTIA